MLNMAVLDEEQFNKIQENKRSDHPVDESHHVVFPREDEASPRGPPGQQILLVRGFSTYLFDTAAGTFKWCSDSLRDRSYFELVQTSRNVAYAISTFSCVAAGTCEKYDAGTNKWVNAEPLPRRLRSLGAVCRNHKLYTMGGVDIDTLENVTDMYCLDTEDETAKWELQKHMALLVPRFRHAAHITKSGRIWVAGGIVRAGSGADEEEMFTRTTEYLDLDSNGVPGKWTAGPPMVKKRAIDVNLMEVDGVLYAVGGDLMAASYECTGEPPIGTIEKLDAATNKWTLVSELPERRRGMCKAAADSKIYCFGGRCFNKDLSTWDAFDLKTGTWLSSDQTERNMPGSNLYGSACNLTVFKM